MLSKQGINKCSRRKFHQCPPAEILGLLGVKTTGMGVLLGLLSRHQATAHTALGGG